MAGAGSDISFLSGENMKVCLVGSSGGHLTHLYMLKPFWKERERFWVTFDKQDAASLLSGEQVYHCYFPTNRNVKNLIRNTILAWKVLRKEKPDLIVSSGAAMLVPCPFSIWGSSLARKPSTSKFSTASISPP